MTRFLKTSMARGSGILPNYAIHKPYSCDLSLVTGPNIWNQEIKQALADHPGDWEYPMPPQDPELVDEIARFEGVAPDCIWLTPGADCAIEFLLHRFLDPGGTLGILAPNFPRFQIVGSTLEEITVRRFSTLSEIPEGIDFCAVCTPNNPSTEEIPLDELKACVQDNPNTLFCIDAVFDWYSEDSLTKVLAGFDNVVLLKSFSKIGLAALRLGYVVAARSLIEEAKLGWSPFCVPPLVQKVGLAVSKSFHRLDEIRHYVDEQFLSLSADLGDAAVRRSKVPFYLLRTKSPAAEAADSLASEGIGVVHRGLNPECPAGHLRIAIGTPDQNLALCQAVDRLGIVE